MRKFTYTEIGVMVNDLYAKHNLPIDDIIFDVIDCIYHMDEKYFSDNLPEIKERLDSIGFKYLYGYGNDSLTNDSSKDWISFPLSFPKYSDHIFNKPIINNKKYLNLVNNQYGGITTYERRRLTEKFYDNHREELDKMVKGDKTTIELYHIDPNKYIIDLTYFKQILKANHNLVIEMVDDGKFVKFNLECTSKKRTDNKHNLKW